MDDEVLFNRVLNEILEVEHRAWHDTGLTYKGFGSLFGDVMRYKTREIITPLYDRFPSSAADLKYRD